MRYVATASGPLRVSSHATVTEHYDEHVGKTVTPEVQKQALPSPTGLLFNVSAGSSCSMKDVYVFMHMYM